MKHYDKRLKQRLQADSEDDIVLNRHFASSKWLGHIKMNLAIRERDRLLKMLNSFGEKYSQEDIDFYKKGDYSGLYEACMVHSQAYTRPVIADKVIVLVHPFYMFLSHMHEVNGRHDQAEVYWNNMMRVISEDFPKDKFGRIVFETIHHYAAATSLLIEQGVIDQVMFTKWDSGCLICPSQLGEHKDKRFFVGGGYNGQCLKNSLGEIIDNASKRVFAVKDIIVNGPHSVKGDILSPDRICDTYGKLPKSRIVCLDDLI